MVIKKYEWVMAFLGLSLAWVSLSAHAAWNSSSLITSGSTKSSSTMQTSTATTGSPYPIYNACNKTSDACAQNYSTILTSNYQQGVRGDAGVGRIPNPVQPCYMSNCTSFSSAWGQVTNNLYTKQVLYNPGPRPWVK